MTLINDYAVMSSTTELVPYIFDFTLFRFLSSNENILEILIMLTIRIRKRMIIQFAQF
jgi:hypothetical protein